MFENLDFVTSLEEDRFDSWLRKGRESKIRYNYLVIMWDEQTKDYRPIYLAERSDLEKYTDELSRVGDVFVAAYDLFTESKIL